MVCFDCSIGLSAACLTLGDLISVKDCSRESAVVRFPSLGPLGFLAGTGTALSPHTMSSSLPPSSHSAACLVLTAPQDATRVSHPHRGRATHVSKPPHRPSTRAQRGGGVFRCCRCRGCGVSPDAPQHEVAPHACRSTSDGESDIHELKGMEPAAVAVWVVGALAAARRRGRGRGRADGVWRESKSIKQGHT